jgi:hypothetical protein
MHISAEGKLGLLVGLLALGGAGAVWVAPDHTEMGWGMIAVAAAGVGALAYHHFSGILARLWNVGARRKMSSLIGAIACAIGLAGFSATYLWQRAPSPNAASSDIIFLPPLFNYNLEWNPAANIEVIMLPVRQAADTSMLTTGLPVFRLKNIDKEVAKDLKITWNATNISLLVAVEHSNNLKPYNAILKNDQFAIFSKPPDDQLLSRALHIKTRGTTVSQSGIRGYVCGYSVTDESTLPYLAPQIDNTSYTDVVMPSRLIDPAKHAAFAKLQ